MERFRDALIKIRDGLDEYGMPGWIAAMVLGFVVFFPIGLILLGYMLWSGRMGCKGKMRRRWRERFAAGGETGNAAFDAYREETLRRLEEERQAFAEFMERLRKAKDQAEFDQFMRERGQGGASGGASQSTPSRGGGGFEAPGGFTPQPAG